MTITVLSLIPITIFFIVMQRQIVNGLVAGAVKG
jgi:raffinose/stachyose/melibiose transport system permease protein